MSALLIYVASGEIKEFCAANPVQWSTPDLYGLGGAGDRAGMPPVSSVEIFLDLLRTKCGLFSQAELWEASMEAWGEWFISLPDRRKNEDRLQLLRSGLRAKTYHNFYPSMIDSLHVWAMLVEVGGFDRCFLDSVEDHTGKTDITVHRKTDRWCIALQAQKKQVLRPRARGVMPDDACLVRLPMERAKIPGNKRWFEVGDFFEPPNWCFNPGWQTRLQRKMDLT